MSRLQVAEPSLIVNYREAHVLDLPQTLPHDMDVVDVQEDHLCVLVTVLMLIPSTLGHVGNSIHLGPGIVDIDPTERERERELVRQMTMISCSYL